MKKEQGKKELKKVKYSKPVLIKHKKLKELTAGISPNPVLGCTKL